MTKYLSRDVFAADLDELEQRHYRVARFDCSSWNTEGDVHADLKRGLELPGHTGANYDALEDSLADISVPDSGGLVVALDNFSEANRSDVLLHSHRLNPCRWPADGSRSSRLGDRRHATAS